MSLQVVVLVVLVAVPVVFFGWVNVILLPIVVTSLGMITAIAAVGALANDAAGRLSAVHVLPDLIALAAIFAWLGVATFGMRLTTRLWTTVPHPS